MAKPANPTPKGRVERQGRAVRARAAKPRPGRPSKLTENVATLIEQLVRAGSSAEIAAQAAGVSRATFYSWMAQGATARPGSATRDLHDRVERARAESETTLVARIATAASKGSWQAALALLERRFPERWMKPSERPLPAPTSPPDEHDVDEDPFADVIELAQRRRR